MANFLEIASSGDYLEFTFNDYASIVEQPNTIHRARKHKNTIIELVLMEDEQSLEFVRVKIEDKYRRVVYDDGQITLQQSLAQKTLVVKSINGIVPESNTELYDLLFSVANVSSVMVDMQTVGATDEVSTTSTSFSAVPDLSLTTKNLLGTGKYNIIARLEIHGGVLNAPVGDFAIYVDGAAVPTESSTNATGDTSLKDVSVIAEAEGVTNGTDIAVYYKRTGGSELFVGKRALQIIGVRETNLAV